MNDGQQVLRVAAVADLHREVSGTSSYRELFAQAEHEADVLLLCGDLTDYGTADEARRLAAELTPVKIPILAVLGNHDFEAGQQQQIGQILGDAGVRVLDGQACEIKGVGFAGTKGFAGGFGVHTLEPWGEACIKHFVQDAVDEAMKLELALSRLRTECRIALLHYAPVRETVEGEPLEIYPFLGSSRLEEPLNRYQVRVVFHGHAHAGAPEAKTREGIPVYNVSLPVLRRVQPTKIPLRVVEVPVHCDVPAPPTGQGLDLISLPPRETRRSD